MQLTESILGREASAELSPEEMARYARHLVIADVGISGQRSLREASVLLIGTGGLGSPAALYLAAAGVGRLGLVDFDVVDHSNLQRQVIHSTADIGRPKLESARDTLTAINPNVNIDLHAEAFDVDNAMRLVSDYDLVLDGTDNFPTRYLVNDACVFAGKPNVYGSIFQFEGQASVFWAERGPCYRCLFPAPPPPGMVPNCAEGGVLGILPGLVGVIQATEAIKLILGQGDSLLGRLLLVDSLAMRFREMKLRKDPGCPICGDSPSIRELRKEQQTCGLPEPAAVPEISPEELLAQLGQVCLLDVRKPHEVEICRIVGSTVIPLDQLSDRLDELDASAPLVVHCKMGGRSAKAVRLLLDKGFCDVRNLSGGILAWADKIDPEMPRY
jgi:molybdopterin/thiamine biosynthesis adenylyltransferase/rhodanese-related sulfurtransferase